MRHRHLSVFGILLAFVIVGPWQGVSLAAKTEVVFWTNHGVEEEPSFQAMINAFEACHPNITINWTNVAADWAKLETALLAGAAPDVFYVRPGTDYRFVRNGWVYDIEPWVQRDRAELNVADFIPSQVAELKYQGRFWALPYDLSTIGIYYNQNLFDIGGLAHPQPGWGWTEMAEAARKLTVRTADQVTQWGLHGLHVFFAQWGNGLIRSFGGSLFDDTGTRVVANQPGTVDAFTTVQRLTHEMQVATIPNMANYGQLFFSGKAGMAFDGSWATMSHRRQNSFDFDVSTHPEGPAGLVVHTTGGAWAMWSRTKVPVAAWEFLKHLASPEVARTMIVDPARSLPPRVSLVREWADSIARLGKPTNAIRFAQQAIEGGVPAPLVPVSYPTILVRYRGPLMLGQISPQEAAQRIETELRAEMQRLLGE